MTILKIQDQYDIKKSMKIDKYKPLFDYHVQYEILNMWYDAYYFRWGNHPLMSEVKSAVDYICKKIIIVK